MKNWSFYIRTGICTGFALLMMGANCTSPKSSKTASPDPAVSPTMGQSDTAGRSARPLPSGVPTGIPKEVGQGAAPDQVKVDSLKAAAEKERAKSQGKKKPRN